MDVSFDQVVLLVAAVGGLGAVAQHFWDRYASTGLYKAAPKRAAVEIEAALNRAMDRQRALAAQDMAEAMKAQEQAGADLAKSAEMSMLRGIRTDKGQVARVSSLLGEAILGPALPLLRQFAPGLADALEENPQLIDVVVRNPLFIKYVQPRIEQYLGSMGTGGTETEPKGWG